MVFISTPCINLYVIEPARWPSG